MSELERFLPADQDILVSLFYRVGQWMSQVDPESPITWVRFEAQKF